MRNKVLQVSYRSSGTMLRCLAGHKQGVYFVSRDLQFLSTRLGCEPKRTKGVSPSTASIILPCSTRSTRSTRSTSTKVLAMGSPISLRLSGAADGRKACGLYHSSQAHFKLPAVGYLIGLPPGWGGGFTLSTTKRHPGDN